MAWLVIFLTLDAVTGLCQLWTRFEYDFRIQRQWRAMILYDSLSYFERFSILQCERLRITTRFFEVLTCPGISYEEDDDDNDDDDDDEEEEEEEEGDSWCMPNL
ncbi:hypothetical protein HZH66_007803 [Vespula vulgaris]|uniref:Uncharacterized protein n=1 Tax=Vespula vulgaris TaxID=7454 RepID=A0A834JU05_VESVU|nr:hypothetical protein HZH66_007803 [Vespula vulgaris]